MPVRGEKSGCSSPSWPIPNGGSAEPAGFGGAPGIGSAGGSGVGCGSSCAREANAPSDRAKARKQVPKMAVRQFMGQPLGHDNNVARLQQNVFFFALQNQFVVVRKLHLFSVFVTENVNTLILG